MTQAFRIVIPARFGSTRLPGKPLLQIAGKPMIAHVWERALESGCRDVWVATDDQRIFDAVFAFGGQAVMTSQDHASGTDRLAEVADILGCSDEEILVNLQGDEPLLPGALLRQLAEDLCAHGECGVATLATPIRQASELFDPAVVKVVTDERSRALYFSRAPIPWHRESFALDAPETLPLPQAIFKRHLGLYSYRASTLRALRNAPRAELESIEALEQLRALFLGIPIHVGLVDRTPGHGVDTPADLERVRALVSGQA